ncbi:MAG: hypothetical protein LC713_00630 [Actinobacteria bacterium]|nr:hypothetical protein [Actinomycetota bacterium]
MILYCPRCGAAFPVQVYGELGHNARCVECGVALAESRAMLAKSPEEVRYGLDEWPLPDRVALTTALAADGIPYRWEPDIVLVVPEVAEEEVDSILDQLEDQSPELSTANPGGIDGAAEAADGGEEAHAAMVDLFLAADRLRHSPHDPEAAVDVETAAEDVAAHLPPYGIERSVWQRIGEMAAAVVAGLDRGAAEEAIARDARGLRNLLRDYV